MTNPDREELVKIADEARSAAIGAISHVSLANYAEREREAKQWVRNTFDKLDDALRRLASSEDAVKGEPEPVALSASERACYLWPDDTEQARACRAAYIDGAKDYTAPTADAGIREALANLLAYTERNECPHESTSRGGAIWTICDDCGRKWADDQGGFKPYAEPAEITAARAALTAPGTTTKSDGGFPTGGDGYCGCTERCKDRDNCQYDVKPEDGLNDQDEVLLAYGMLWSVTTTDKRVHAARRDLLKCLNKELQAKAISAARTTLALVRDIRQMKGATFAADGVPGDAVGTVAAAAPIEMGDAVVANGPSDFCSDSDCEDQGLCPTDVCTKFECQQWVDDVRIRPALVLRGKYWVCPKCHSSYGEDAKGRTPPGPSDPSPTRSDVTALADIAKERQRQREVKGWSLTHDDAHVSAELAMAGACYALAASLNTEHALNTTFTRYWPWGRKWWKPKTPRENLVRAGALIVAEIERIDRLETHEIRRK